MSAPRRRVRGPVPSRTVRAVACAVALVLAWPAFAQRVEGLEDWQREFLAELEAVYEAGRPVHFRSFTDYALALQLSDPRELLRVVEERVALVPYRGSMVDPAAALMGGRANALDRARLLKVLLENAGHEARIVWSAGGAEVSAAKPPGPEAVALQPIDPALMRGIESQVERLAGPVWQALCGDGGCEAWVTEPATPPREKDYRVQVNETGRWSDLAGPDTALPEGGTVLDDEELERQRWRIGIEVVNRFGGGEAETALEAAYPAAELHGWPISYDNVPLLDSGGFTPTLMIGERPPVTAVPFTLESRGRNLERQVLRITVSGPGEAHQFTRELATPDSGPEGLELVSRARLTVLTGPLWEDLTTEQFQRNMARLANLVYAEGDQRDPRPLNLASFRAYGLLILSHRLAGHAGRVARGTLPYQARPAIVLERDYAVIENGAPARRTLFDLVDPGHAFACAGCRAGQLRRAAVEQGIVDGVIEDWLAGGENARSSLALAVELIASGADFSGGRPSDSPWTDRHAGAEALYRLARTAGAVTGWRLDPGPQAVPILAGGAGGAISNAFSGGTSAFITNVIRHAMTKCGASDISFSIILALAGAPMTTPLLSGIVGHMCRVAEAYNRAADAINCLEFMGNDCSSEQAGRDLENMLRGLGEALAIDLAVAQAADLVVGGAIDGVVSPAIRRWMNSRWARTPRAQMPPPRNFTMPPPGGSAMPPGGSVMPPGGSVMPPPGGSVMPPGGSVMPPPGGSAMPPGGSAMPPGGSAMPPAESAMPPGRTSVADEVDPGPPRVEEFGPGELRPRVEEFGPGDLPPRVEEFGPGELPPAGSAAHATPTGPVTPGGRFRLGRNETWVGVVNRQTGKIIQGPWPSSVMSHADMIKPEYGDAFTIARGEGPEYMVSGSGTYGPLSSDRVRSMLDRMIDLVE